MLREPNLRGQAGAPRGAPVQTSTPLYRLLQLIAREIAKDLDSRRQEDRPPLPRSNGPQAHA
jgi:hypothetical protein